MALNNDNIESTYSWYNEQGHSIPNLAIRGPYPEGKYYEHYTNLILYSSDWGFDTPKACGTFTDADMIKLRDVLLEKFPLTPEDRLLTDIENDRIINELFDKEADPHVEVTTKLVTADDLLTDEDWDAIYANHEENNLGYIEEEDNNNYLLEYDPWAEMWIVYETEIKYNEIASFAYETDAIEYYDSLTSMEDDD